MKQFEGLTRYAWAEINIDNLRHNFQEVRRFVGDSTKIMTIIKADAYGHGAIEVGKALADEGADCFGVATLSEALLLKENFPDMDILILGYTPLEYADVIISNDIIQTIFQMDQGKILSDAAKAIGKTSRVHIKLDTGMRRLGLRPTVDNLRIVEEIIALDNIKVEAIFTHFSTADEKDKKISNEQIREFDIFVDDLRSMGIDIEVRHLCNSAGIIELSDFHREMVRPGIMLYGLYPSGEVDKEKVDLRQVMSLRAKITHIKDVYDGEGVSYGASYRAKGHKRIATVPLGYADGYSRLLTNKGEVIVGGKKVPIVGKICMDQFMIDVTDLDVFVGDVVTLYGGDKDQFISIDEIAEKLGTINYEVICMVNKRVPRVYIEDSRVYKIHDEVMSSIR